MDYASGSVDVSRVLFGFAVQFHYLFVPLTIGLAGLIALLDWLAWRQGDPACERASAFWSRFFVLNFICGVLTGWPLRYHLATQWSGFTEMAADVLGQVFLIEGRIAPLLFGLVVVFAFKRRLPGGLRAAVSLLLAVVLVAQSLAILALNAWMQLPAAGRLVAGRFLLEDSWALFANPLWPAKAMHTLAAAYVLGGGFMTAISAWLLLRHRHEAMARATLRVSTRAMLLALAVTALAGHQSGRQLQQHQPAKFAAIEGLWEPVSRPAALTLLAWPDAAAGTNRYAITVPGLLDLIAGPDEPLPSLREIQQDARRSLQAALYRRVAAAPADGQAGTRSFAGLVGASALLPAQAVERDLPSQADIEAAARRAIPPVAPVFLGFRLMVGVWAVLLVLAVRMAWRVPDVHLRPGRRWLWLCVLAGPLPWLATMAGWTVCEVGRQPWVVSGLLTTAQAAAPVSPGAGALGIVGWGVVYAAMLSLNVGVSLRWIRRGPPARRGLPQLGRQLALQRM